MRTSRLLLSSVLVLLALAACGTDDHAASGTRTSRAPTARTIEVTTVDYQFRGLPEHAAVGTKITMHNDSTREVHELTAFRLPASETRSVAAIAALPPDQLENVFAGPPDIALAAPPGKDATTILGDGTLAKAGRYVMVCFIPTGADPDRAMAAMRAAAKAPDQGPPQIEGGPPHFMAGMYGEIVVD
jgi:hypothetical protein